MPVQTSSTISLIEEKKSFFCTWATLFREAEKDLFFNDFMVALFDGLQSLAV